MAGDFSLLEPPAAPAPLGLLQAYIRGMMTKVAAKEQELAGASSVDVEKQAKLMAKLKEDLDESQT